MARPTKAKEPKPKATEPAEEENSSESKGGAGLNILIMGVVIILCTALSSAASVYFLAPLVIKPILSEMLPKEEGEEGEGEEAGAPTVGPVLDLEEFTVNLKDPGGERYLRADLSLSMGTHDPEFSTLTGEALHKWQEEFHHHMGPYVPAIRDIIIAALTKRTAEELSTVAGKQQLKDEIKNNVEAIFHGQQTVLRVNLENFIIQ